MKNNFKYVINGNDYEVSVENINNSTANVEVNGVTYQVTKDKLPIKQPVTVQAREEIQPQSATATETKLTTEEPKEKPAAFVPSSGGSAMKSPLPGIILDIKCKVGDSVKVGQPVLILEAMKMENAIAADRDGVIVEIKVAKGVTVLEGEDLIVIG
ncbi:MAG: acetyl-CoA carboxylase biotin carboxyl carrier protein subunit [Bacteroidales bacterium]|jgi:biotin carboxyl carrier protein|nr:acetyl-CoA carboxylase biotin carboxyl carrier protein subunit [Bacteroidales bacterium]